MSCGNYDIFTNGTQTGGKPYKQVVPWSHYRDPVPDGESRIWGRASSEVQSEVINSIIGGATAAGLSTHDTAYLLAIARVESGFNPNAAAGTTSASGIGQFIDKTGAAYGLDAQNRWGISAQVDALIGHYMDMKALVERRGQGEEYIYKYWHDGPSKDYGGLEISLEQVMPRVSEYEEHLVEGSCTDLPINILDEGLDPLEHFRDDLLGQLILRGIPGESNADFFKALEVPWYHDPLVLDLNGNGLDLVGANGSVLFDHNADGIKTGTGWAAPSDGFLVRDLDGNGTIDSGRELFGVDTVLSNGTLAANGFAALANLDSNADGKITSADTAFGELKVWQDLNQDGISQGDELKTLDELGITSIDATGSNTGVQQIINGNRVALSGTFTRNGVTQTAAAMDLETNNFYSEFPPQLVDEAGNPVAITEQALSLPQMNGSGMVRNMRAAASLDQTFADALQTYANATTRDEQRAQLDGLIDKWARTSTYWATLEEELGGPIKIIDETTAAPGGGGATNGGSSGGGGSAAAPMLGQQSSMAGRLRFYVATLEAFNGSRFYAGGATGLIPNGAAGGLVGAAAGGGGGGGGGAAGGINEVRYYIRPQPGQLDLLEQAYDALKESVYKSLALQTRLRPYLDSVELVIDDNGIHFDTTQLGAMLDAKRGADERNALIDLVELNHYATPTMMAVGFDAFDKLHTWVDSLASDSPLRAELKSLDVYSGADTQGSVRADVFFGDPTANNYFDAGGGDDRLQGGAGNDTLLGGAGDDVIDGGAGNDVLSGDYVNVMNGWYGGRGNDTYLFGRGDGQDIVYDYDTTADNLDRIIFKAGVLPTDVVATRWNDSLVLKIAGTSDQLTVNNYFSGDGDAGWAIEAIQFTDAPDTVWNVSTVKTMVLHGSDGDDMLQGYASDDVLTGNAGNDYLYARAGNDVVDGGAGDDNLFGEAGNDTLLGGDGNDNLQGGTGDDTLDGGAGNDVLAGDYVNTMNGWYGGQGNDTYLFGRGDGQDTVYDYDTTAGNLDKIVFKAGVLPSDIVASRHNDWLVLKIAGTSDQVTVVNYFSGDGDAGWAIEEIHFTDAPDTVWNAATVKTMVLTGTAGDDDLTGYATDDALTGNGGHDNLYGMAGNDVLDGGAGDDYIEGGAGNDLLLGSDGNDNLQGGTGDDTLDGGAGNDVLAGDYYNTFWGWAGGAGNDTYLFGRGDGKDTVYDYDTTAGNLDKIVFKAGVLPEDVLVSRAGDDLVLKIAGTTDQITVAKYFTADATSGWLIEEIRFADDANAVWRVNDIKAAALIGGVPATVRSVTGTDGADVLTGSAFADVLFGLGGNDTLTAAGNGDILDGGEGDDVLNVGTPSTGAGTTFIGGAGNDTMTGSASNDIYVFNLGDGHDTITDFSTVRNNADVIKFGAGIAASDVTPVRSGANLVFQLAGGSDQITVKNWFADQTTRNQIEQIQFADGTTWTNEQVSAQALAVFSTAGNDTYEFGFGSGQFAVADYQGRNTVKMAAGVSTSDLTMTRDANNNLVLSLSGGADILTLNNWYLDPDKQTEQVTFADGTVWDLAQIAAQLPISGTAGDEYLRAGNGDHAYDGKGGNDTLAGGTGNDTYVFGFGSGQDTVYDDGGRNRVQMSPGVSAEDVALSRDGNNNLVLTLAGGADTLTLHNNPGSYVNPIGQVIFADGTVWDLNPMAARLPIVGTDAPEYLYADNGNYVFNGLGGDDTILGGRGDDTYVFGFGSGHDSVHDYGGNNTVQMSSEVTTSDVTLSRDGNNNLIVTLTGGADTMTLHDWFQGPGLQVQQIRFADGTSWDLTQAALQLPVVGTAGNDYLVGGYSGAVYDGLGGNDTISGSVGSDTYLFGFGSGQDTIADYDYGNNVVQMSGEVSPSDVTVSRVGVDLVLTLSGGADSITFRDPGSLSMQVSFADGTAWDVKQMAAQFPVIGTAGNDYLRAGSDDSVYNGMGGDDTLAGGAGNDTYIFGFGSGNDTVYDFAGNNTVKMSAGVSVVDVSTSRDANNNLVLTLTGGSDTLTVPGVNGQGQSPVQQVVFADGAVWDLNQVVARIPIMGTEGDDYLSGSNANAIFDGLGGNDTFSGGWGNDTYVFGFGSGHDTVWEGGGRDTVQMSAGVLPADVTLSRDQNNNLILTLTGDADSIELRNWYDGSQVEQVTFADGTVWNLTRMAARLPVLGTVGNDHLDGGSGNDLINGFGGDDQLDGGAGDDTYVFGFGSGQDTVWDYRGRSTLQMSAGISASDVTLSRDGNNNLIVTLTGGADSVTLANWYADASFQDNQVTFADGTVWNLTRMAAQIPVLGTVGDDYLNGGSEGDVFDGLAGNDSLVGGPGNDTYLFGFGSGQDTVEESDGRGYNEERRPAGFDTIKMHSGVNASDVTLKRYSDNNLVLTLTGGTDTITVKDWYGDVTHQVEQVTFADGAVWDLKSIAGGMLPHSSATYFRDGQGDLKAKYYDADMNLLGSSSFASNGHGSISTTNYDVDGNETGYSTSFDDGKGYSINTNFDAGGVKLSDSWANAGGSSGTDMFNSDGSRNGTIYDGNGRYGAYVNDGQGHARTDYVDYFGNPQGYDIFVGDGDGNGTSTSYAADGTEAGYSIVANDGLGKTLTSNFDANGVEIFDTWAKTAGTSGSDWFYADGRYEAYVNDGHGIVTATSYDPSGDYMVSVNDQKGNNSVTSFDAGGVKLRVDWNKAGGSSGNDIFNSDGTSTGTIHNADGSYATYSNDGQGHVATNYFDVNDFPAGYSTLLIDGHGNTKTTNFDANGIELGYSVTADDGLGNTTATGFDSSGVKLSESWTKADGTSGGNTFNADGGFSSVVNDGHGNVTTTNFDASGVKFSDSWIKADGSSGDDAFNSDGASRHTIYYVEGGYSSRQDDGHGDSATRIFDVQARLAGDTWLRADGSSGADVLDPLTHAIISSTIAAGTGGGGALVGHAGQNTFVFKLGSGHNVIDDSAAELGAGGDILSFGAGVKAEDVSFAQQGADVLVSYSVNDSMLIKNFDLFGIDGQVLIGTCKFADGSSIEVNGSESYDGPGTYSLSWYDPQGRMTRDLYVDNSGGNALTTFNADASFSGASDWSDGTRHTYTQDAQGNYVSTDYAADGFKTGDYWRRADGSSGSDQFNSDGSSTGSTDNVNGSVSNYTNDGHGEVVIVTVAWGWVYDPATQTSNWQQQVLSRQAAHADGSSVTDFFDPSSGDVTSSTLVAGETAGETLIGGRGQNTFVLHLGGGQQAIVEEIKGSSDVVRFASGITAGDTQFVLNGEDLLVTYGTQGDSVLIHGFAPNGATAEQTVGTFQFGDGSSGTYISDAYGNSWLDAFNAEGQRVGGYYQYGDGSHGNNYWVGDGSAYGHSFYADGSRLDWMQDTQGNYLEKDYRADGSQSGDYWENADGSWGDNTFNADGSSEGEAWVADGAHSSYISDGQGNITTQFFDVDNNLLSTVVVNDDGHGNVHTTNYDADGNLLSDSWTHPNAAPLANPLADQGAKQGEVFSFHVPDGSFTDPNAGDTLSFKATLADGSALPAWLTFDAATQTFRGTPGSTDVGTVALMVTATDAGGLSASTSFGVSVVPSALIVSAGSGAGSGYTYSYQTLDLGSGTLESKVTYAYADGSTYSTDTVSEADGSYQQSWSKSDGSTGTTDYMAATGEVSGSNVTVGAGYSYTYDNTKLAGGASESKVTYTYTDGSSYSTDTVSQTDGSYQQAWTKSDGSHGDTSYVAGTGEVSGDVAQAGAGYSYAYDNTKLSSGASESKVTYTYADGTTYATDTVSETDGSYHQTWAKSDGSTGSTDYNAVTGEVSGSNATAGAGYSYAYDNTRLAGGASESKVTYTYADGSTYATDTVSEGDGSYLQAWSKGDGSHGDTNYVAASGEVSGDVAQAGAGYSYVYDNTKLAGGATESKVTYTYADGSSYSTDTVSQPDGSYQQAWSKGDGSHGDTNYVAASGEVSGDVAQTGAGYRYSYDNTVLGSGASESKVIYTYTDGSTYSTDTVSLADGSYDQAWSKSDGTSGNSYVDVAGHMIVGSTANNTLVAGAGSDVLIGGAGSDTYELSRGAGADVIVENDASAGNTDTFQFDPSIASDKLWFRHVGNNLEVDVIGTSDSFTVSNWYLGSQYHVEQFKTSDGKTLLDSQVQNLVNAMASFTPPAAGQTTLPPSYATALEPVIAANWQ
jgi:Ca2+-binding RTX toxin-like protein